MSPTKTRSGTDTSSARMFGDIDQPITVASLALRASQVAGRVVSVARVRRDCGRPTRLASDGQTAAYDPVRARAYLVRLHVERNLGGGGAGDAA